jgi:hypothetical protein
VRGALEWARVRTLAADGLSQREITRGSLNSTEITVIASALLQDVSTDARWVLVAAAVCLMICETYLFGRLSRQIRAGGGPGYNDFQRAGSAAAVARARAAWGPSGLAAARKAWTLDLVYPATYALLGVLLASLAVTYARAQDSDWLASAMEVVAWLAIAAGATDLLIENPAVAVGLWSSPRDTFARIAKIAGRLKLALIAAVFVAFLVALVVLLVT